MNELLKVILLSVMASVLSSAIFIPFIKNKNIGQPIREEGNKAHYAKAGTPTMGGIAFLIVFVIMTLIFSKINANLAFILVSTIGFGFIGFIDDYEKVTKKQNLGLNEKQKILLQLILAAVVSLWAYFTKEFNAGSLYIPFIKQPLNIGFLYVPLAIFIIIGTVNATNLTDGVDGLLTSVSIPVFFGIALMSILFLPDLTVSALVFASVLIGFLVFNSNPASVFMGDTGSMAIGGAFVSMMLALNRPVFIIFLGGIYLIEALSLIIQVSYFKRTKRRVFLMSPIHHHYELKGYKEPKIVASFTVISVLLTVFTLYLLV